MNDRVPPTIPDEDTDFLEYEHYKPRPESKRPRPDVPELDITQPARLHRPPDSAQELTRPHVPVARAEPPRPAPQAPSIPAPMLPQPTNGAYRRPPPPRRDNFAWVVIAILALAGTLMAGLLGFVGLRLVAGNQGGSSTLIAGLLSPEAATATPTLDIPTFTPPTATPSIDIEPWDGVERFTVLLMGLDRRPRETGTAFRTDSMILISLDPVTRSIGMLSIPRDLYVEIPRDTVVGNYYGLQRVNTGYFLGERVRPGYGPMLAMQTVQYNLGIRVHDYIVYDFEAVIEAIDAIGGIEIDVPRDIVDYQYPDMYGGYDPLYIRAGRQVMNGELALKYARVRHGSSDIERARRQQQVIMAVRDKVFDPAFLPEFVIRAPGLWAQLSQHVRSGLSVDQLLRLGLYAKDIPLENIRKGVIDFTHVQSVMWNGASVLVPSRATIGPLLVEVFGPNYNQ